MGLEREERDWIEAGLNKLHAEACLVSDADCAQVRRYIDVGEYGLALDDLADIHLTARKPVSGDNLALFDALATKMGMRSGNAWGAVAEIRAMAS